MSQQVLVAGTRISTGSLPLGIPGFHDALTQAAGAVRTPWVDASTLYPTMFDPAVINNNRVELLPTHIPSGSPAVLVGHVLMARDIGVSDNFEVGCNWRIEHSQQFLGQVGPAVCMDLSSTDPLEMGLSVVYDISLGTVPTYIQNCFRESPISDVDNVTYYTHLANSVAANTNVVSGDNFIVIRVINGMVQHFWNGVACGTPQALPSWAVGRTRAGIQAIGQKQAIGALDSFTGATITEIVPDIADSWYWHPL